MMRKPQKPEPNGSRAEMVEGVIVERKVTLLFTVRLDDGRVLSQCFIGHKDAHRRNLREIVPEVGERVWVEVLSHLADTGRIHLFYRKSGQ